MVLVHEEAQSLEQLALGVGHVGRRCGTATCSLTQQLSSLQVIGVQSLRGRERSSWESRSQEGRCWADRWVANGAMLSDCRGGGKTQMRLVQKEKSGGVVKAGVGSWKA